MATKLHEYPVVANWTGGRDGSGDLTPGHSGKTIPIAVPPEFDGPGGETNPEELLTSAVAGCYAITLGIITKNRRLPVASVKVEVVGVVDQQGANFTYKAITLRPTVTVEADATDEQVAQTEEMAHKADAYCIITNAVRGKVEISIEPTVVRASS
jgi:peroxiredoxin-like protein